MNSEPFNGLARLFAMRSNRRRLGTAALASAITTIFRGSGTRAQPQERTCTFDLIATVVAGPSAGQSFQGVLSLPIVPIGAIDDGRFLGTSGFEAEVVGMGANRRLRLRIDLGDEGVLVLIGAAQRILSDCRGEMNGVFGGPRSGDLGTWTVMRRLEELSSDGTPTSAAEVTRTPCPPIDCGSGVFALDLDTCECGCPGRSEECGDQCCPGGSICDAPNQSCQCPQGTELCNDLCVSPCPAGQSRNTDNCQCVSGCGSISCTYEGVIGQVLDENSCICVDFCTGGSPYFCGGACYPEPMVFCGGICMQAAGNLTNPNSCGASCTICPTGVPYIGGSCQCPFGYTICPSGCSDLTETHNCGGCGIRCNQGIFCTQGVCCSPSGIFAQCSFDSDCCSGACYHDAVANVTYCI